MSAISDWCTGMLFDFAMPVANRVQNSMNALTAKPDRSTKKEKKRLAMPTMGTRRTRSASQPIGTAPRTKNADDAVPMKTIAPLLMWNVLRMFGPSTWIAAPSSSSNASSSPSTMNISRPPLREGLAEGDGLGVDARQQVVGEDHLLGGARLCLLARRLLVQDRGRERSGIAPGLLRLRQRDRLQPKFGARTLVAGSVCDA